MLKVRAGLALFAFHILVGFGFMAGLSALFGLSPMQRLGLLAFHLLVNGIFWTVVLILAGVVLTRWPVLSIAAGLIPAILLVLTVLIYAADEIYIREAGLLVSYTLASGALREAGHHMDLLAPPAVWGTLAAFFLTTCCLYVWLGRAGLIDWGKIPVDSWRFTRRLSRFMRVFIAAILLVSCFGASYGFVRVWRNGEGSLFMRQILPWYIWRREPLFGFVMLSFVQDKGILFPPNSRNLKAAAEDAQEREHYGQHAGPRKNVILIIVDCLRADHLSINGYPRRTTPFLERLQAAGRLRQVAEMRSTSNNSPGGILGTLLSRSYVDLGPGLFGVQDVLHSQGYKVNFIMSGQHTSYADLGKLYGPSVDFVFDGNDTHEFFSTDDRLLFEGLSKVPSQNRANPQPAFFYFHLMSAHSTGIRLPRYSVFQPAFARLWGNIFGTNSTEMSLNTYDNGILMADATIEQLMTELQRKGYLQNSLLMILGDHGDAFGEHGCWHHSNGNPLFEQVLRIPLLIVDSPDAPYRNLTNATQLDIAPTILERLSLPVPRSWQGRSLQQPDETRVTFHYDMMSDTGQAVVSREDGKEWKLLHSGRTGPQQEALYELRSDPGEDRNRVNDPAAADALRHLRTLLASQK
jgi:hypothetical protein